MGTALRFQATQILIMLDNLFHDTHYKISDDDNSNFISRQYLFNSVSAQNKGMTWFWIELNIQTLSVCMINHVYVFLIIHYET